MIPLHKTLKRKRPKIHYYKAKLMDNRVYIWDALKSKSRAVNRLRTNAHVFATSSGYAASACKAASPIHKISTRQRHTDKQGKHYYHYHPMLKWSANKNARKQMKSHCWFL